MPAIKAENFYKSFLIGIYCGRSTGTADPLQALLDLMCWRKIVPESVPSFLQGLRLEPDWQSAVQTNALPRLRQVYQHRRRHKVIDLLTSECARDWVMVPSG